MKQLKILMYPLVLVVSLVSNGCTPHNPPKPIFNYEILNNTDLSENNIFNISNKYINQLDTEIKSFGAENYINDKTSELNIITKNFEVYPSFRQIKIILKYDDSTNRVLYDSLVNVYLVDDRINKIYGLSDTSDKTTLIIIVK